MRYCQFIYEVLGSGRGDFLGESLFLEEGKLYVKISDGTFLEVLTIHLRNEHTYTFKNQKYIKGGLIFNAIFDDTSSQIC